MLDGDRFKKRQNYFFIGRIFNVPVDDNFVHLAFAISVIGRIARLPNEAGIARLPNEAGEQSISWCFINSGSFIDGFNCGGYCHLLGKILVQ